MPPDIVNEEDCSFGEELSPDLGSWKIPDIKPTDIYKTTWLKNIFLKILNVRTVEQTYSISKSQEKCYLLNKEDIKKYRNEGFKYIHIGSVQIAAKPLTRLGINASVLFCLRDGRFLGFEDSILGMVQSSLSEGPVHFDCFPNITLALTDEHILKCLILNILTSGYHMIEGSKPLALIFRIYYRLLKTNLDPKAIAKPSGKHTLLIQSSSSDVDIKVPKRIAKIKQTIKFILVLLFIASKSVFILSFPSFVIIHLH